MEPGAADAAAQQLQAWLAGGVRLHHNLALLLEAAAPAVHDQTAAGGPSGSSAPAPPGTPPLQQAVPSVEALLTTLTSRSLAGGNCAVGLPRMQQRQCLQKHCTLRRMSIGCCSGRSSGV